MDADGQVVRIDEEFQVGNSRMLYPGDPNGMVEDVVNCHCTYSPIVKEELSSLQTKPFNITEGVTM
jgi:hypothetical protein